MFARPRSKQNILTPSLWWSTGSVIQIFLVRGPSREHRLIAASKVSLFSKSGLAVVAWNGAPCDKSSRSKASSSTRCDVCPRWWRWSGGDSKGTFELEDVFAPVRGLSALGGGRTGGAFTGGQVFLTSVLTGLLVSRGLSALGGVALEVPSRAASCFWQLSSQGCLYLVSSRKIQIWSCGVVAVRAVENSVGDGAKDCGSVVSILNVSST